MPLGYTEAFGLPSLRARIARHYAERYGLDVPPARVAVTVGASGAFPLAFLAAFDPGDAVAMAAPFYPPYANILTALGMKPLLLPCDASTRFQPTVAMLERLDPRPAGLVLASPCNPAGTMLPSEEFIALARWCEAEGVRLISDEIYHGLSYGDLREETAAAHSAKRRGGEQLLQILDAERMVRAGITTAYDCGARGMTAYAIRDAIARVARSVRGSWSAAGRSPRPAGTATSSAARPTASTASARRSVGCSRTRGPTGSRSCRPAAASRPGTDSRFGSYSIEELAAAADEAHRLGKRVTSPRPRRARASTTRRRPGSTRSSTARCSARTGSGPSTRRSPAAWSSVAPGRSRRSRPVRATRSRPARRINKLQPNPGAMTRADWWANARALYDAGVTIVPGTDVGINFTDFGEDLFLELEA